ncbi:E3 ubiquitin-protein ligase TRIM71-like [Pecten maximus]|uniref:E3 ubiquitin-protein ligase TRIM71-like n=1 Tax=Pecten maximus TaxID=6579 RepID=UPI0014586AA9|nr:E3 ubiquitin-protein ligase TRIM71-like [Pecten maximus]
MACSKHRTKPYEMVCSSCNNKLVCHECIEKKHIGHKFVELKTAAERIIAGLQKQKKENTAFDEIQLDLKDSQTLIDSEQKLAEQTRDEVIRRRDLLKRIIDEIAEKLLLDQEKYFSDILSTLEEHKKEDQEKVQEILKFQSELAVFVKSNDYTEVIEKGQTMSIPKYTKHAIPSMIRMRLKPGCPIDRDQVLKVFGPIDIDNMINSYIVHPIQVSSVYSVDSVQTDLLYGDGERLSNMTNPTREQSLDMTGMDNDVGRRHARPELPVFPVTLRNMLRNVDNNMAASVQSNGTVTFV